MVVLPKCKHACRSCAAATGPQLGALRISNLCDLVYALALLRAKPSQRWLSALTRALRAKQDLLAQVGEGGGVAGLVASEMRDRVVLGNIRGKKKGVS